MKELFIPVIVTSLFICSTGAMGQQKVIEGMVTTFDSIPVIGASIQVKSTKEVVLSDSTGIFMLSCAPKDQLKVRAGGFSKRNVRIHEETRYVFVNLHLLKGPESREIAIGYGHVKDIDKLYAVTNVNNEDLDFSYYRDIYDIIRDQFIGIQVMGDGSLVIRNAVSIAGSNAALLIVDGREVDLSTFANLNTVDIANISVLKDASAAVYGSRGGNGVVIVETKRGGK